MSNLPKWLPTNATSYRETEQFAIWEEPSWRDKSQIRTVRRKKYLCVGGPFDNMIKCTREVNESSHKYFEFNQSAGGRRSRHSMIMVFVDLLSRKPIV